MPAYSRLGEVKTHFCTQRRVRGRSMTFIATTLEKVNGRSTVLMSPLGVIIQEVMSQSLH